MPAHKMKVGYASFRRFAPKIAEPSRDRERKARLIMPTRINGRMCIYPENLVKIVPVSSEDNRSPRGPLEKEYERK